jgi:hypothetical protein
VLAAHFTRGMTPPLRRDGHALFLEISTESEEETTDDPGFEATVSDSWWRSPSASIASRVHCGDPPSMPSLEGTESDACTHCGQRRRVW